MNENNNQVNEISLIDIFEFLQESWRTIASYTALGIAGAALFLWASPKQYMAIAQIQMAQIVNINNNNNNINPQGSIYIEEPQALIARMALPTSYPKETIAICGLAEQKYPEVELASKVNLSIPRGVSGVVDLKIRDGSKDTAKVCANSVYQLIKSSQAQLVAPYIDEASKKLEIEKERLGRATQLITRADKSGAFASAAYLATRDEIRYLLDQISVLQNIIISKESRSTRLIAPIYLKEQPVFPQKRNSLLAGLLIGGFLGLALALARKQYRSSVRSPLKS